MKKKNLIFLTFLTLIILVNYSCKSKQGKSQHKNGKFNNYISLEDKTFKDGDSDFYPMIMNYSIDVNSLVEENNVSFFATPRGGYHPNYGNKEKESISPWGGDSSYTHATINSHFASIKDMGFNALRITGFTSTDTYNNGKGFHTWSKIDISNSDEGNKNIINGMVPLLKRIIRMAEDNGLRVILLLSAIETQPENQLNFYSKIADALKDEKALMAYDFYNEPLYFDKGNYTKSQTKAFVESYNKATKDKAPNHLTTIGLSHYKIVAEWDPELMDVDFLSFHIYPYGSKNLSILERFEAKLYWISRTITKPWIIGETGLSTPDNCDPLNFSCGSYSDQLYFMSYSLNKARSAKSSGYSWWSYQDMDFPPGKIEGTCSVSYFGLVNSNKGKTYLNSKNDTILGEMKQELSSLPFKDFLNGSPYNNSSWDDLIFPKDVYYNIDYLPSHGTADGRVLNDKGMPIENAIITIFNTVSKATYTTFSKPDGTFHLNTGWTNVFSKLDFKIKITAVKMETVEFPISKIYKGEGKTFEDVTIGDYK